MGAVKLQTRLDVEEYLRLERASQQRHEYLDGRVLAMAGESGEHADIHLNLSVLFGSQLKGTPCRARAKDTKVRSGPVPRGRKKRAGLYSYPDLVVICGEPKYHDIHKDVILNPKAIIEVLSESTEAFDRGEKFTRYQTWNPTLTDYVLVSQDKPQVEHFARQSDGSWSYRLASGPEAEMTIASIGCTLKLAEVYDRVTFPADEEADEED